jgi:hypothetical protein
LIPGSTKELLHKGWGSPRPPHKVVVAAPHQVGGSMTCQRAFKAPRCRRTEIFFWFTQEPQHKDTRPIKRLLYKGKGTQAARINAEAKGRDERKQTFDARIYPVVQFGLPLSRTYIHVVEALTKSIASWQSSLFCEHNHGHLDPVFQ